jgi:hypothetical protein
LELKNTVIFKEIIMKLEELILNMVNSIEDKKRISYNVSFGRRGELCGFDTKTKSRKKTGIIKILGNYKNKRIIQVDKNIDNSILTENNIYVMDIEKIETDHFINYCTKRFLTVNKDLEKALRELKYFFNYYKEKYGSMADGIGEGDIYLLVKNKDTRLGRNLTGASKEYGIDEVWCSIDVDYCSNGYLCSYSFCN